MIDRDMIDHLEANGFRVVPAAPEVQKAEGIINAVRSTTPTPLAEGTVVKADLIRHLREGGLRIVETNKVHKLTARKAETLQTFNYHGDVVPIIKGRMAFELAQALLEKNGWTVEDKGDLRIFTMELEVIL